MALVYVDTSTWVAMSTEEPMGARAADQLLLLSNQSLCLSDWVIAEFASAISLKRRRQELDETQMAQCHETFDRTTSTLTHLSITSIDYQTASELCREFSSNLRASDALHLAIALRHKCKLIFSLDAVLNEQAKRQGIRVVDL